MAVLGKNADMRSYSHRGEENVLIWRKEEDPCVHARLRPLLSYRGVRGTCMHGHRLGILGYGDVRCAAIHSHRQPLEMGFGRKDASPCAHARPRP